MQQRATFSNGAERQYECNFPRALYASVGRLAAADRKLRDGDENLHLRAEQL